MARSAMGGMDGVASPASTIAPRVGGAPSVSSARSGGGLHGSGSSAPRTTASAGQNGQSPTTQQAGAGSGKGAEGASPSPAHNADTATLSSTECGSSESERNPVAGALSGVATGMAVAGHVAAKLASISVPGMEGMAGGVPSLPPSAGRDSAEGRPFKGDDVPPAPTNTIMPSPTGTPPVPPAQEVSPSSATQPPKDRTL